MAVRTAVELVEADLAAQRIAVHAQDPRRARLVAIGAVEHTLDELFLKFADRLLEEDTAVHHLSDEGFELIFQGRTLRKDAPGLPAWPLQASSWPVNRQ